MENQHRKISGYRELSKGEIDAMNHLKDLGAAWEATVATMKAGGGYDQRWVSIGETHLQQGLMALVRAIAKPETF